ncbi:MAG: SDR family NAD(P)-dependent oxidoreductase [Thiotrichales bacterium]|nr:SDR family NAD(P)-dependent oxidoreductase [Thiotrichales bacterium]
MKHYLITGAAQGLGRALTRQLVAQGHFVILLDKAMAPLVQLYDELEAQFPEQCALYPLDLLGANIDHYQQLGKTLTETFGGLDGVFLNAAILPAFTPIAHFQYSQWYEVLHTNLNANFHLIQVTLPCLLERQGSLVAILDTEVEQSPAFYGAYGVAKSGLAQLVRTVAAENCAQPLHCTLAHIGVFATESRGRLYPGENPTQLCSAEQMAQRLLNALANQQPQVGVAQCITLNADSVEV